MREKRFFWFLGDSSRNLNDGEESSTKFLLLIGSDLDVSKRLESWSLVAFMSELQALSSTTAMLKTGSFERTKCAADCNNGIGLEVKSIVYNELMDPLLSPQNAINFTDFSVRRNQGQHELQILKKMHM